MDRKNKSHFERLHVLANLIFLYLQTSNCLIKINIPDVPKTFLMFLPAMVSSSRVFFLQRTNI